MNIAVHYATRTGNTQKLADAIAKAVGVVAKNCHAPLYGPVDMLFIGGSVYAGGIDKSLREFISKLNPQDVKCAATFGTSAIVKKPCKEIEKLLRERGIAVAERNFYCRGAFTAIHRGRPNDEDLKQAAEFAADIVK